MKGYLILAVIFLLVIASGCGKNSSQANQNSPTAQTTKKQLVIGLDNDPPQLDPQKSSAAVDRQVYQSLYNTLVDIDSKGKIVPELATSWKISSDGKTLLLICVRMLSFKMVRYLMQKQSNSIWKES
ncbi:hypothetical protein QS257_18475 [Terrilactibacillus sp. S3-3]|nr:hypothetical protein QS257_18475 [Terrilactibacillus sp. S3-3]